MTSRIAYLGCLAAAIVIAAACGSPGTTASASPSSTAQPAAAASPSPTPTVAATGAVINVASTRLGTILVDGSGRTLYLFVADKGTSSVCYGQCATYWPPVLTNGAPQAGTGVNSSLLATTQRSDGTTEITYGGHPLYYFISDKKPGDLTGQGVNGFGGPWYVVSPAGMQIS